MPFPITPVEKPTAGKGNERLVGRFRSNGKANGRDVFEGPRGGFYYYTDAGNKTSVKKDQVDFF